MLPYKRSKRIGDLMREEIADIVMRRVKDPRLGFLTITSVEVTEDLKIARDKEHTEDSEFRKGIYKIGAAKACKDEGASNA